MMTNRKRPDKKIDMFFFLLILYIISDALNSANFGYINANRTIVYIIIFILVVFLTVSTLISFFKTRRIVIIPGILYLLIICIWILIGDLIRNSISWTTFINMGLTFLKLLTYYFLFIKIRENQNNLNHIKKWITIVIVINVFMYIYGMINARSVFSDNLTINIAYILIFMFPLILTFTNNKEKSILIFIASVLIIMSFKRGAIIALLIILSVYYLFRIRTYNMKNIIIVIIAILAFVAFKKPIMDFIGLETILTRFSIQSLLYGSGRNNLYSNSADIILSNRLLYIIIGNGSGAALEYLGTSPHNDWIEFVLLYGILGTAPYLMFIISLFSNRKNIIKKSERIVFYSLLLVLLFLGNISSIFFSHTYVYVMIYLGVLFGTSETKFKELKL